MVRGLVAGSIPDYQIAAWAMAITCRGLSTDEIAELTESMLDSGIRLRRERERPRVDKHSTGGLGDKVSLVLAPLLACFDAEVPMLSGRGLGITGGTLDKLESYAGYRCDLSQDEISGQLASIGCAITGTTPDIAPADRKLYALRDVTGTVPSVALITASILCKKLAESLDALVLDVKFGSGTFMPTLEEARALATSLHRTGTRLGLSPRVVLSNMNQPLGQMVGNACEANEAVDVLRGEGPADVRRLTLRLAAEALVSAKLAPDVDSVHIQLAEKLDRGQALEKYIQMIEMQAGRYRERLPLAPSHMLEAKRGGSVQAIEGQLIGHAVLALGGARGRADEELNHQVGLKMHCRVGDTISVGQPLVEIFADSRDELEAAQNLLQSAICIGDQGVPPIQLLQSIEFPPESTQSIG